ncbi:MAG: hypothetical protein IPG50_05045 [Myxococcales bacterium]|nr:hypothetical protein [Myxococcales bacterium]
MTDPFDPASCTGAPLSPAAALATLGGSPYAKLADATLQWRRRTCTGSTPATCGPWMPPVPYTQSFITYSGGAATDTTVLTIATHLVLFSDLGAPRLSVRHVTSFAHAAADNKKGIVFEFEADPMVRPYPVIFAWDDAPKPYHYQDLSAFVGDGSQATLTVREHCARYAGAYGVGAEIVGLYRW